MIVTKIEAAKAQLNTAVRLFFSNDDPISTHTLAGAASVIFADLIERKKPDNSWEKHAQEINNLSPEQYYKIARKAQNFLKHAKDDPDGALDFNETDTETLMMFAVMNCLELLETLPMEMSVFQLWYLAARASVLGNSNALITKTALTAFPGIEAMERSQAKAAGQKVLNERWVQEIFEK